MRYLKKVLGGADVNVVASEVSPPVTEPPKLLLKLPTAETRKIAR